MIGQSIRLFRIAGIDVGVHVSWLLIFASAGLPVVDIARRLPGERAQSGPGGDSDGRGPEVRA
jgi:hypothetical protein